MKTPKMLNQLFGTTLWSLIVFLCLLAGVAPVTGQTLRFQFGFEDTGTNTVDSVVGATLKLVNGSGSPADYHGVDGSGVFGNGKALNFTSSASGANSPLAFTTNNSSINFGTLTNFTMTMWIKPTLAMGGAYLPRLFCFGNTTTVPGTNTTVLMNNLGPLAMYINTTVGKNSQNFPEPTNQWLFIAVAWDGTNVQFYSGSETNAVSLRGSAAAEVGPMNVGPAFNLALGNLFTRNRPFVGWMDDVRFYTGVGSSNFVETVREEALVTPEVPQMQLQMKFGFDDSGTTTADSVAGVGLSLVNSNGVATDYHGVQGSGVYGHGRALDFTSAIEFTNAPQTLYNSGAAFATNNSAINFGTLTNFTMTMWIKPTHPIGSGYLPRLFCLGSTTTVPGPNSFLLMNNNGPLGFSINDSAVQSSPNFSEPTGQWTFLAVTWDGTNVVFYNGSETSPVSMLGSKAAELGPIAIGSSFNVSVGNLFTQNRPFVGYMDDVRFYRGVGNGTVLNDVRQEALILAAPANLTLGTCSGATLTWSSVPFAAGYIIQRSTSSGAETNYATSAINSYTDSNVAIGTTYFYKIIATNTAQVSASSSEVSGTIQNQSPVTITTQPTAQVACAGDTATFSVAVNDGTGVSYLWQYSLNGGATWTDIPTATTASYTTAPLADTDNGTQYRVLVINSCASVPSDAATLNVVSAVATLTKQPFDQTVVAGWPAAFSVKATGASLIYQWRENGVNLLNGNGVAGATTASLTLSNTTTASSGFTYDCVVGPACYAVTSSPALLTVNQYASNNLVLQFDFEDAPNGTTTTDSVHGVTLNLVDSGFASVDLHGQPGSGVSGVGRALDMSSGATMGGSGPLAYAIGDASVNYGAIGSFTLTLWANPTTPLSGFPRYFILGAPGTSDTSSPDAFGFLKSTGESLYINGTASDSLTLVEPANQWTYMAVTWDGQTVKYYSGSTNGSVTLLKSVAAANGPINVGNTANLLLGNNGTQTRAFAGKMDNVRLYLGAAPMDTLETIRQAALPVAAPQIITGVTANGDGSRTLSFSANPFYTYQVQFATNLTPPVVWQTISTNTADANGLWQFTDTNAIPHAQGFYRSVYQP